MPAPTQTELVSSALTAWTPAQQAALYAHHRSKQNEVDEDRAWEKTDEYKAIKKQEREAKAKEAIKKGYPPPPPPPPEWDGLLPETVEAKKLVNDLVGLQQLGSEFGLES